MKYYFKISKMALLVSFLSFLVVLNLPVQAQVSSWKYEWPDTDFSKKSIDFKEILSGGPPKDGIPSIEQPKFMAAAKVNFNDLGNNEPVISIIVDGTARAYPLRILIWHEIVNDEINGVPIAVTYCPLCNTGIVFDRRFDGQVLDFGTTGKLRKSNLLMYDRQTESWWQQFTGESVVGELTSSKLKMLASRTESFENFKKRAPNGVVMIPNNPNFRQYGVNPYQNYDSASFPFLYRGDMPKNIEPMIRVVAVGKKAWSLAMVMDKVQLMAGDLKISWQPGQNSALDSRRIRDGRDVGNVVVQKKTASGWKDVVFDVTFAFVFNAFNPGAPIFTKSDD